MSVVVTQPRVGALIRRRRQELGWTQVEFARRIGVSESTVIRWEQGKIPPSRRRGRVEAVLGMRLDDGSSRGGGAPLTDAERKQLMDEYLRLHAILFPPAGPEQANGQRGGSVRDEGRSA
jgi:transcriptional regulator with XRE-family HTH domain